MSLDDKLNNFLGENSDKPSEKPELKEGYLTFDRLEEINAELDKKAVEESEFSKAEIEFWNKKRYEDDLQKIEFILQNQEKVPGRIVMFSQEQLEDMTSAEIESIFYEIHSGLGLEEAPKEDDGLLKTRLDQINFILQHEKDLIEPKHWFKNVINFHDIGDEEVSRLYNRMMQMLKLTVKEPEKALNELEEKHLRNRNEKIHYILQQQGQIYKDPKDTFSDEDLAMFSDKYINKLYHQIEKTFLTRVGLSEEVDWDEVSKAMIKRDFAKVAYLFDTTTKLGAEEIVDKLLAKGYSNADVKEVVREIFGGQEVPEYFEFKLNTPPSSEFQNPNDTNLNEDGTTADMAVPTLPAFGDEKRKKIDTWGESELGDRTDLDMAKHVHALPYIDIVKKVIDDYYGTDFYYDFTNAIGTLKRDTFYSTIIDIMKKHGVYEDFLPLLNLNEAGALGATMSQTDLTPDPVELQQQEKVDDTLYEDINTIDVDAFKQVYRNYVTEVLDKTIGDDCTDPTHSEMKNYLSKYASSSKIAESLVIFEAKQFKESGDWVFGDFKKYISEQLKQKKSTVSEDKGKVFNEKPIFKNNETEKSMANESRYPVSEKDVKLLENAAAPLSFKVVAVRGSLVESGKEDELQIVVEKHSTRALVEYSDNAAKPFLVQGKQFTTFQSALGFISENADRFTTEQVENTFNEEGRNRAIKEAKDLEEYTKNSIESYKKERARFEGREIDIMKSIMTEAELKKGFNTTKK